MDAEHHEFLDLVIERQHEAESALVRGDLGPRLAFWSHRDPVTLLAAVGPTNAGWAEPPDHVTHPPIRPDR